jgi:hypothetical protein
MVHRRETSADREAGPLGMVSPRIGPCPPLVARCDSVSGEQLRLIAAGECADLEDLRLLFVCGHPRTTSYHADSSKARGGDAPRSRQSVPAGNSDGRARRGGTVQSSDAGATVLRPRPLFGLGRRRSVRMLQ